MQLGVKQKHPWRICAICGIVYVYLKSNVVTVHARQERLKPFDVPFLGLLFDGLQHTFMTATQRKLCNATKMFIYI